MGLQLSVRHVADVVIVDLHGKATIGRDNELLDNQLRRLIDEGSSKILLNLSDVTQMDSSGISSVLRAFKSLKRRGASLRLLRPRGNVRLVLETVHLPDIVPPRKTKPRRLRVFTERPTKATTPRFPSYSAESSVKTPQTARKYRRYAV